MNCFDCVRICTRTKETNTLRVCVCFGFGRDHFELYNCALNAITTIAAQPLHTFIVYNNKTYSSTVLRQSDQHFSALCAIFCCISTLVENLSAQKAHAVSPNRPNIRVDDVNGPK